MRRLGVLTGLAAERRIIERVEQGAVHACRCAGADSARAACDVAALIDAGAQALLSFGLAAGIDAAAPPGTVLCPDRVVFADGEALATHPDWGEAVSAAAAAAGLAVRRGAIAATERLLATSADKRALGARTGALAADMESGPLARAAALAGLPHLAIRAVADPVERALPDWLGSIVRADGGVAALTLAKRLSLRPWELPALARLACDAGAGLAGLRGAAGLGSALFAVA